MSKNSVIAVALAAFLLGSWITAIIFAKSLHELSARVSVNSMICDFKGTAYKMQEITK